MDIAHRDQTGHGPNAWVAAGGIALMVFLIAVVLLTSTRTTQVASTANEYAPFEWSHGAPPVHPLIP